MSATKKPFLQCPYPECQRKSPSEKASSSVSIIKRGYFITKWNHQPVRRYQCTSCKKTFSTHTNLPTFRQKKPFLNQAIFDWYSSGVTLRRMAKVLKISRTTVTRKFVFIAMLAKKKHEEYIQMGKLATTDIQFDEMETFEHTKLKPLHIALSVCAKKGKILSAISAQATYKGLLSDVALKKYGPREDKTDEAQKRALYQAEMCTRSAHHVPISITVDKKSSYPKLIQSIFPTTTQIHLASRPQKENAKSRALSSLPQRENNDPISSAPTSSDPISSFDTHDRRPKKSDPLFFLNVSAAKIRHDLSRMARKVWVTTKKCEFLQKHLDLYIAYHNKYPLFA